MRMRTVFSALCGMLLYTGIALLPGCFDLAATRSLANDKGYVFVSNAQVFVMRGGLGGIFSTGMNHLQGTLERQYRIHTESTVWYKAWSVGQEIVRQHARGELKGPVILVGHSLGANEQIKVAAILGKANIPVELLLTVDAVSPIAVPANVKKVLNVYKPGIVPMFSGLRVKAVAPRKTRIENLNVNTLRNAGVNHFSIDKNATVQDIMVQAILQAAHYPVRKQ